MKGSRRNLTLILVLLHISALYCFSQVGNRFVRIVELEIDSSHFESFKAALAEDIKAAVSKEDGVLTLHAVYDQEHPTHVTVFEIYQSEEAHKSHQQTAHFLSYKNSTTAMVKSGSRRRVVPIALETKPGL